MHKAESPLEYFVATPLDIPARSGSFRKGKDLQLGLPWPRQRIRWVEDEGGWIDTSPSGSFLASFSLPSCQKKERNEMKLFECLELNSQIVSGLSKPHFRVNLLFLQGFYQLLSHSWFYFLTGYGVLERPAISPLLALLSLLFIGNNFLPL